MNKFFTTMIAAASVAVASSSPASAITIQSMGTANQTVGSEYRLATDAGSSTTTSAPDSSPTHFDTVALNPAHPSWSPAIGTSSWISFENNYTPTTGSSGAPGDAIQNNDFVWFFDQFTVNGSVFSGSTLNVLADDTVSIWVNGTQLALAGGAVGTGPTYPTCYENPVGCLASTEGSFDISSYLTNGNNVFAFQVWQRAGTGYGLDYAANVNASGVPEPLSLFLLGSGMFGIRGLRRRA